MTTTIKWGGTSGLTFAQALASVTSASTIQYIGTTSTSVTSWPTSVPSFPLTFTTSSGQTLSFSGDMPQSLVSPVFNGVTLGGTSSVALLTLEGGRIDNLSVSGSSTVLRVNNSVITGLICDCKEVNINTCTMVTSSTYGFLIQGETSCWFLNTAIAGSTYTGVRMESTGSLLISRGTITCSGTGANVWGLSATISPSSIIFDSVVMNGGDHAVHLENPTTIFQSCSITVKKLPSTPTIECLGALTMFNECQFQLLFRGKTTSNVDGEAGVVTLRQNVSNAKWLSSRNTFKLSDNLNVNNIVKFTSGTFATVPPPQPVITAAVRASNRLTVSSSLGGTLNISTIDGDLVADHLNVKAGVPITIFAKNPSSLLVSVFSGDGGSSSLPMIVTPAPPGPVTPISPSKKKLIEEEALVIAIIGIVVLTLAITGSSVVFIV